MKVKLRTQILLAVGFIIALVLGINTTNHVKNLEKNYLEALSWHSEALAQDTLREITELLRYQSNIKRMFGTLSLKCQKQYKMNKDKHITHFAVIDETGTIVAHNDRNYRHMKIEDSILKIALQRHEVITVLSDRIYHTIVPIFDRKKNYVGSIDVGIAEHVVKEKIESMIWESLRLFGIFIVVSIIAVYLFTHIAITRPVNTLLKIGTKISQGELDLLDSTDSRVFNKHVIQNEIDDLKQIFYQMLIYLKEVARTARLISHGDITHSIQPRSKSDLLGNAFANMTQYLDNLSIAATTIASGDLSIKVQPVTKNDTLGNAFHSMACQLRDNFEKIQQEVAARTAAQKSLERLNEELEQRVIERTAEITRQQYILNTFMDNVPDRIYFKDRENRFIRVNHSVATLLGTDADLLIGKSDYYYLSEEQAKSMREQDQEIMRTGRSILAQEEPDIGGRWSLTTKMPLRDELNEIIGTFGISRDITDLKEAQSNLAAAYEEISVMNDQLKEENLRMEAELDIARRLQEMILPLPQELEQCGELDIAGYMEPAEEVGGDYYDVLFKHGALHIGIGDVTGHGLESGVVMLMTQSIVRALIEHGETDLTKCVTTLNHTLYKNIMRMNSDKSLTFSLLNYQDGRVTFVGQHEEILLVRSKGSLECINTMDLGFPIGLVEDIDSWVKHVDIELQSGDGVVLYTDGITEAENKDGEMYGLDRLCNIVSQYWPNNESEVVKQAVIDDVIKHIGKQTVYDDITLVVMKHA